MTRRAIDQHQDERHHRGDEHRPVGAAARAADGAVGAGRQLGLEDPTRVDRRVGVALVVGRQQGRRVDAQHPGQGAQVAAGVEVAAARGEVVDLDRLDDVGADPGALGQLVDGEAQARARRQRGRGR